MTNDKSHLMKIALATLISIVITGVGSWMALGKDAVSRTEAIGIVREYSPYKEDKKVIQLQLKNLESSMLKIDGKLDQLLSK